MITLHFNPQYDSGAWSGEPGKGVCKIEDSYVGPMGLLNWLEVRLGITAQEKAPHENLAAYAKAAQQATNKNSAIFFAKSIRLTSLATADELLKWRDELVRTSRRLSDDGGPLADPPGLLEKGDGPGRFLREGPCPGRPSAPCPSGRAQPSPPMRSFGRQRRRHTEARGGNQAFPRQFRCMPLGGGPRRGRPPRLC